MLPTSTNVSIAVKTKLPPDTEAVVVFAATGGKVSGDTTMVLGSAEFENAQRMIRLGVVKGKLKEVDFDLLDTGQKVRRIYVAGLGSADKIDGEVVRQAAGSVMKTLRKQGIRRAAIVPPVVNRGREAVGTEVTVEGLLLAAFDYQEYRGAAAKNREKDEEGEEKPKELRLTILSHQSAAKAIQASVNRARLLADSQNYARTIAFRPGNDVNPPRLAQIAQEMAREVGLKCRVLDEKEMKRLGMGGILAVGAGSASTPPRMIVLEWEGSAVRGQGSGKETKKKSGRNPAAGTPLLLVGKAITFDTGGISIKPAANMQRMVFDKCGAMAVLGAMCAIARLKLPIPVIGILSSAENHISGTAYRPGDILRMYNGVTVEVTNTDAEGRLVLADALAWGVEQYKPAAVIDLATLTGAMVIALGHTHCGVMSNDDDLVRELEEASKRAGEKIWRLPLEDSHREAMKSDFADIVNSGTRDAGSIKAAAFLSFFVPRDGSKRIPWAHMDVAGVADLEKETPYYGKGATGWGVRTLVHWVESRAQGGAR
jgi:leucyl aminopeptidase